VLPHWRTVHLQWHAEGAAESLSGITGISCGLDSRRIKALSGVTEEQGLASDFRGHCLSAI